MVPGRDAAHTDLPTKATTSPGTPLTSTRDRAIELQPGTRVGNFRVEARIGAGGLGVVYRAYDEKLKREVALKVLAEGASAATRLLEEARSAASLTHPAIATIHEVRQLNWVAFIVMELVLGTTLRAEIARGAIAPDVALRLARAVASGLARAHRSGIVHRDLKPENVMVTPEGGAKILDFGLARDVGARAALHDGEGPPSETGVAGTPHYMSPEQARGRRVDARSDVFSFGVVLFEMLAGTRPYAPRTAVHPLQWNDDDWSLSGDLETRAPAVPAELARVVMRCIALDPAARYADGGEVLEALGAIDATPFRAAPRARWPIAATLALGVASALGIYAIASAARAPAASADPAASAASASKKPIKITDRPAPPSSSPAAIAAYREALGAYRDGSVGSARAAFLRATEEDPSLAEAWLRLANILFWSGDQEAARDALRKIASPATRLDDHDRSLFEAYEALMMHDPPDWDAYIGRLHAASDRDPEDSELAMQYAVATYRRGLWNETIAAYGRAIPLDPGVGEQYRFESVAQARLGDLAGALATGDACDRGAPTSAQCAIARIPVHIEQGACAAMEADARALVMRDKASGGPRWLAEALASEDAAPDAVKTALDTWLAVSPAHGDPMLGPQMRLTFDVWTGDFTGAQAAIHDLEKIAAGDTSGEVHAYTWPLLAEIALETGKPAEARRWAEKSLAAESARIAKGPYTVDALSEGSDADLLAIARAGGMPAEEYARRLEAWRSDWEEHLPAEARGVLWLVAYAGTATTPEEAKDALALLPRYEPLPPFRPQSAWYGNEANVYWLAGDVPRAIALLEKQSASCDALVQPFAQADARLRLGEAKERVGDRDGACAAYARASRRWSHAKPASTTATRALARMKALGCAASTD